MSTRAFAIVAGLILMALAAALFHEALFDNQTFIDRDLMSYYRPAKSLITPLAQASEGIPLWNPLFSSGQPFAANPEHEIFHPLTALFFFLPFEWVFRLQVILPLFAGAACMFVLLRVLRRSRPAALFGGLSWGFGGYLLSTTNLVPILLAASVLPLVLAFSIRVAREKKPVDVVGLAFSVALVCLAGEPSTLLATPPLIAAAVWSSAKRLDRSGARSLIGGLILGGFLGAAALLPGIHHAGKTVRAAGLADAAANEWSMPVVRILDLFIPHPLGHVDRRHEERYWGGFLYPGRSFAFLYSLYPGLAASLLGIAAWIRRRRTLLPWMLVAAAGFAIALGDRLPIWSLLRRLPLLSGIRFSEKFALLFILPLTVASAYGFDQISRGPTARRRILFRTLAAISLAGWLLAIPFWHWPQLLPSAAPDALRLGAMALGLALLFFFWQRIGPGRGALLLCVATALDIGSAGKEMLKTAPIANMATPPKVLRPLLGPQRDILLFHLAAWDPVLSEAGGLAPPPIPAEWGIPMTLEADFDLTQLEWTHRGTVMFWKAARQDQRVASALLSRRGVTDILKFADGVHWDGNHLATPPGSDGPLELLRTRPPSRFAFAVSAVEIVQGDDGWLAAVQRLGTQIPNTAIVDAAVLPVFPGPPGPAEVVNVERRPTRLSLEISARGPQQSFIAINQTWDDGWTATLDGQATRLLRTDISLSGIVVPPGIHRVELVYRDRWIEAGLWLSALAGLVCLALILVRRTSVPENG